MEDKQLEEIGRFVAKSRAETLAVAGSEVQRSIERLREELDEDRVDLIQRVGELAQNYNDSLADIDSKRNAEHLEEIQKLTEQIRGQEVFEAQLTERLASIKDGEKGEQGEQGLAGEDGLDRPLVEPVDLIAEKNYPKNTLGTHQGGLWISTKQTLGDPQDDPHSWHCILDAMTTLSVDLQEDHTFLMSVRTATGKTIDSKFEIPFPQHEGIWEESRSYSTGQIVTKGSSMWQAMEDTDGCPPGNGWKQILSAPRGRAGKDGKQGEQGKQGVPGRNGVDAVLPPNFVEDVYELATKVFEDGRSGAEAITSFRGSFHPSEAYRSGDVVNHMGDLYLCTSPNSSGRFIDRNSSFTLVLGVPDFVMPAFMDYQGQWTQKTYKGGDVVVDSGWTMCALTKTTDRAGPQPTGLPAWVYDGTLTPFQNSTKSVVFGNRYSFPISAYISRLRVDAVAGNRYVVYYIPNPLTNPVVNQVIDFVSSTTGWVEFSVQEQIIRQDDVFDVVAYVNEPDPTPVVWTGNWNYQTPNNPSSPGIGVIQHANNNSSILRISKIDNDGGNRATELEALQLGDIISSVDDWTILSINDQTTYIDFGVNPAQQAGADGIRLFSFNTVTATPIDVGREIDYWVSNDNVSGLFDVNGDYSNITPDDNAYGIDIQLQEAFISDDWGFVARSTIGATSVVAGALTAEERRWVSANSSPLRQGEVITSGNAWTEVGRVEIPDGDAIKLIFSIDAKRIDGVDFHVSEWVALSWNDGGNVIANLQKDVELGADLSVSLDTDGDDMVIRVKGKPNQDWDWKMVAYYRELH